MTDWRSSFSRLNQCCCPAVDLGKHKEQLVTFLLRLRAGDDPLHQAAPHEGFPGEARFLPFPRILGTARRWFNTVGVPQQAVDHLAIRLEGEEKRHFGSACELRGRTETFICRRGLQESERTIGPGSESSSGKMFGEADLICVELVSKSKWIKVFPLLVDDANT